MRLVFMSPLLILLTRTRCVISFHSLPLPLNTSQHVVFTTFMIPDGATDHRSALGRALQLPFSPVQAASTVPIEVSQRSERDPSSSIACPGHLLFARRAVPTSMGLTMSALSRCTLARSHSRARIGRGSCNVMESGALVVLRPSVRTGASQEHLGVRRIAAAGVTRSL